MKSDEPAPRRDLHTNRDTEAWLSHFWAKHMDRQYYRFDVLAWMKPFDAPREIDAAARKVKRERGIDP